MDSVESSVPYASNAITILLSALEDISDNLCEAVAASTAMVREL